MEYYESFLFCFSLISIIFTVSIVYLFEKQTKKKHPRQTEIIKSSNIKLSKNIKPDIEKKYHNELCLPKTQLSEQSDFLEFLMKQNRFNEHNDISLIESKTKPYIIGIAGGSGSGKTYISNLITEAIKKKFFNTKCTNIKLSTDSYYKGGNSKTNYDIPKAIDFDLLVRHLEDLISGKTIQAPIYDFSSHQRKNETITIEPAKIIIVEGILTFTQKKLRELCDLKIFVLANESTQIFRRFNRDVRERSRTLENITEQYEHHVGPSFHKYVLPSSKHADMIINNHKNCYVGVKMMLNHIINVMSDMCVSDTILEYDSLN